MDRVGFGQAARGCRVVAGRVAGAAAGGVPDVLIKALGRFPVWLGQAACAFSGWAGPGLIGRVGAEHGEDAPEHVPLTPGRSLRAKRTSLHRSQGAPLIGVRKTTTMTNTTAGQAK